MLEPKLIIVAGMSGAGKSTTAHNISIEFERNGINHTWLHEEINDHPIRSHEFRVGDLYSETDFRHNLDILVERWWQLAQQIAESGKVYVLEGCLYQNIIRYFFEVDFPKAGILDFYDRFAEAVASLNPVVVFLYSSDAKKTLQRVFPPRGEWWENLILDPGDCRYLKNRGLVGPDGIYRMWQDYQEVSDELYGRYSGRKIKIDTSQALWDTYQERLFRFLELAAGRADEDRHFDPDVERRCGTYRLAEDPSKHIEIKYDGNGLYCKAFWDYMKITEFEQDRFRFSAFPIELRFVQENKKRAVQLVGNYDWHLVGKTLFHEMDMTAKE